jgi:hypothetical protein
MADEAPVTETPAVEAPAAETPTPEKQAIGDTIKEIVDKTDPPAAEKRKYKSKVDGVEEELELTDEEVIAFIQKGKASGKRFQEASEKAKQVEAILEMLKKDPKKALSHPAIGHSTRKLAEEWLAAELEEELMDPKEKELRTLREQKAEVEGKLKEREEADRSAQEKTLITKYEAEYARDIETTIKANGLPFNKGTVNRVRDAMLLGLQAGQDVKAADVIKDVKKDFETDIKELFAQSPAEMIAELLGEDSLKKVRSWDIARLKNPIKKVGEKDQAPTDATRKTEARRKTKSTNEYFNELRKKFGDGR